MAQTPFVSILAYGPAGAGKSALGVSSFWDYKARKQLRRGRWITFGREDNPALDVPEELRIRLTSPAMDSTQFADTFEQVMRTVLRENMAARKADKPVPIEALCIDGLSEFDLMYEQIEREGSGDKFAVWNSLLSRFFRMIQLMDPNELGCHIVVTARVGEKRLGSKTKDGKIIGDDPDYMSHYFPSVRGQFKTNLPHYFNMVLYLDRTVGAVQIGERVEQASIHRINLVPGEEYLVKNNWEHKWLAGGKPKALHNAMFDDVLKIIQELA